MSRYHYDRDGNYIDRDATDEPEEVESEEETQTESDETPKGSKNKTK